MLYLEENLSYSNSITPNDITLNNYNTIDLIYTVDKLYEAEFLNCEPVSTIGTTISNLKIVSLTYQGHQFLDNIRDDDVWNKSKKALSNFKSTSISFVANVASQIISNIISNQLGL